MPLSVALSLAPTIAVVVAGYINWRIAVDTHRIVNNQRTIMLNLIAALRRRIALENPDDELAQTQAVDAAEDARKSREHGN